MTVGWVMLIMTVLGSGQVGYFGPEIFPDRPSCERRLAELEREKRDHTIIEWDGWCLKWEAGERV